MAMTEHTETQLSKGQHNLLTLATLPAMVALRAWAIMLLWGWHVTVATDWPPITFWTAVGIVVIVAVVRLALNDDTYEPPTVEKFVGRLIALVIGVVLLVGIGWLAEVAR
jgi:hypothetical protein